VYRLWLSLVFYCSSVDCFDFSNDRSKSLRSSNLPLEFGELDIGARRKRGRLERSEDTIRSGPEENFEHPLESNGGSKVPSVCKEQYEYCVRHKEWVRRIDERELESRRYLDDDELEVRWTNWVSIFNVNLVVFVY
jgi:hypothetical protein